MAIIVAQVHAAKLQEVASSYPSKVVPVHDVMAIPISSPDNLIFVLVGPKRARHCVIRYIDLPRSRAAGYPAKWNAAGIA